MKKRKSVLAAALLLCGLFTASVFADSIVVRARAAGQLVGYASMAVLGSTFGYNVSTGFSVAAEGLWKVLPYLQIGAGLEYQMGRSITISGTAGTFQFMPIYGILRVPLDIRPFSPYAVGRIGYGILSGDSVFDMGGASISGGFYVAAGGGVDVRFGAFSFFTEAAYAMDEGSISPTGFTFSIAYSRLELATGLSVSF